MNVYKSVDNTNTYLISGIDYDVLSLINSALKNKILEVNSRIVRTEQLKNETTDKEVINQLKDEINYLKYMKSKIESSLQKLHSALTEI